MTESDSYVKRAQDIKGTNVYFTDIFDEHNRGHFVCAHYIRVCIFVHGIYSM
jgi:hypothetical protein